MTEVNHGPRFTNIVGQKFNRLTVLSQYPTEPGKHLKWLCRCDCGNEKVVQGLNLKSGHTQSCGCAKIERMRELGKKSGAHMTTHGESRTPLHRRWLSMKNRCNSPGDLNYHHYGGKGVKVCKRWNDSYVAWVEDMGRPKDGESIERIDSNGHYSCGNCEECLANGWIANCKWATRVEQNNNTSRNRFETMNGIKKTIAQWCHQYGVEQPPVLARLKIGWTLIDALTKPLKKLKPRKPTLDIQQDK